MYGQRDRASVRENLKSRAKEEKNNFKSSAKEKISQKNSKPRTDRGAECQFLKILKSRAKEGKNSFKSYAKEKKFKRTLSLVRKRGKVSIHEKSE